MLCSVNNEYYQNNILKNYQIELKKKKLNIQNSAKIILIVANLEKRKNILMFMNLVKFTKNLNYHYIIAGDGKLKNIVKKKIIENKNKISYLGFVDISEISEIYSIADLFLIISSYDPSPKTLNEVLNFNIPCIVYKDIGTANDLIRNNINGYILNRLNEYSLLSLIKRSLSNNKLKTYSKIFNKNLLKKFSPTQNAKILINENT
jgi:glycosyltransferase involved in cell wall biosynthesis